MLHPPVAVGSEQRVRERACARGRSVSRRGRSIARTPSAWRPASTTSIAREAIASFFVAGTDPTVVSTTPGVDHAPASVAGESAVGRRDIVATISAARA